MQECVNRLPPVFQEIHQPVIGILYLSYNAAIANP
jgi:hypothetical protein